MVLQSDGQVSSMSISEAQQQGYSLTTTAHRVVLRSQYKQPHAELIMVGNHGGRKELHGFCITNTFNEKLATTDWRNTLRALPDGVLYNTNMFSKLFDALFMFTQVNFVSVAQLKCPPERAAFRRVLQRVYCHAKCARGFGNGDKLQTPKFVHLTVQIYLAYSEYTYLIWWSDIMLTKLGGKRSSPQLNPTRVHRKSTSGLLWIWKVFSTFLQSVSPQVQVVKLMFLSETWGTWNTF